MHTHRHTLSGRACQRSNTPCLVSSKLTGWQTCLSVLCQYSLEPLVMGHTPNDRSRSFPLPGIINPPSGPCPAADAAERHTQWTCRSTMSYCAVPMAHKKQTQTHTYTANHLSFGERSWVATLSHLLLYGISGEWRKSVVLSKCFFFVEAYGLSFFFFFFHLSKKKAEMLCCGSHVLCAEPDSSYSCLQ